MNTPSFFKKITAGTLVLAIMVPSLWGIPRQAHAQWVVSAPIVEMFSSLDNVKQYILDPLAWMVAKAAVQSITKSIVNWINSGFNGSPAFVTDLKGNLLGVGDGVTKQFVLQLTATGKINSPFLASVIKGVAGAYFFATNKDAIVERLKYNLAETVQNDRAFLSGEFSQGGFNGWFAASQNPQNNPWGTRILAEQELNNRIDSEIQKRLTELGWGKGFLSWRKCTSYASGGTTALDSSDTCTNEEIQTPGSIIEDQLATQLGSGVRQLELADSFNEIIGALGSQLITQVLGGTGLGGTTQKSGTRDTSFLDQATNDTSTTSSLQSNFLASLDALLSRLTTFENNWSKIKNAAEEAVEVCGEGNATVAAITSPVIEEATTSLSEASLAIASTTNLRTRAAQSVSNDTDVSSYFLGLSNEYDALLRAVSFEKSTRAQKEASDEPDSLYTKMKNLLTTVRAGITVCATS